MNKIAVYLSSFLLLINSVYSQSKKSNKDFNKDGVLDQVTITEDGGSDFSSKDIQFIDGKSKRKFDFSMNYSFGSFFAACNIPNAIGKSGRESLGTLLFGKRDSIDPSLNWLIDACSNNILVKDSQLADFATKYSPIWITGEPKVPKPYYTILSNDKFQGLLKKIEGSPDFDFNKMKSDFFWIDYNPDNHGEFKVVQTGTSNQMFSTSHGLILKKQNKYSWVFINDNKVFEANDKLRWPSIIDVQLIQGFVIVKQSVNTGNTNLFIINPETGFVIRLSKEFIGLTSFEKIEVNRVNESISLSDSTGNKYSLTLKAIEEIFQKIFSN